MGHAKLHYEKEQVQEENLTLSTLIHNFFQIETTLTKLSLESKKILCLSQLSTVVEPQDSLPTATT